MANEVEPVYGGTLNFGFTNQFLTFTSILANQFVKLAALDLLAGLAGLVESIVTDSDSDSSSAEISNSEKLTLNFGFTNQFLTFTSIQANQFVKLASLDLLVGLAGLLESIVTDFDSDPANPVDTDGDSQPDLQDVDSDGDKIPDAVEAGSDPNNPAGTNGDGTPNFQPLDSDEDEIPDPVEAGSDPNNPAGNNGDRTPDVQPLYSDKDGIPDPVEAGSNPTTINSIVPDGVGTSTNSNDPLINPSQGNDSATDTSNSENPTTTNSIVPDGVGASTNFNDPLLNPSQGNGSNDNNSAAQTSNSENLTTTNIVPDGVGASTNSNDPLLNPSQGNGSNYNHSAADASNSENLTTTNIVPDGVGASTNFNDPLLNPSQGNGSTNNGSAADTSNSENLTTTKPIADNNLTTAPTVEVNSLTVNNPKPEIIRTVDAPDATVQITATDDPPVYTSNASDNIILKQSETNPGIFSLQGNEQFDQVNLKFTLTDNNAKYRNEIGVFKVDDPQGRIDGIAPGEESYLKAALSSGRVIFSALSQTSDLFGGDSTRIIEGFSPTDHFSFFLVQDSTVDAVLADLDSGNPSASVFFATKTANGDRFDHLSAAQIASGGFSLKWEDQSESDGGDADFDDLEMNVEVTNEQAPLGNSLQGGPSKELLNLSSVAGQQVRAEFLVQGNSDFDNRGGLYKLADASGAVPDPLTGVLITPGEKGYTKAALAQSAVQFDESDNGLTVELEGGALYAPYLLADGEDAYFPFLEANTDGVDHLRLLRDNTFGFEDLANGGDFSYNDYVFEVNFTPL